MLSFVLQGESLVWGYSGNLGSEWVNAGVTSVCWSGFNKTQTILQTDILTCKSRFLLH